MSTTRYLLGYDLGSSSVKATLLDIHTGQVAASATSPEHEMSIHSVHPGWAEQDPELWWTHIVRATQAMLATSGIRGNDIEAIGISYQMHGLVAVDASHKVLRASIIWCDSRAVDIGNRAFRDLGHEFCLTRYLNSPGNFTLSKLKWVQENEPSVYERIHKIMLPGDYIAMKLTDRICTTVSGLSEGIMWDFPGNRLATDLFKHFNISTELVPEVLGSFQVHGELTATAADTLGLKKGTRVTYKAGDQPNNAFSLNVLKPGEVATTAGTSGVMYGVTDAPRYDSKSRVNTFVHVNHQVDQPRYGTLLCINGTGILNRWLKDHVGPQSKATYADLNAMASRLPIGSDGLSILPFGNGAERILENRGSGAVVDGLEFNRHQTSHLYRAAQEGIVFSLNYGFQIMKQMGLDVTSVKAGYANMFLSDVFRDAFVNTTGAQLQLYNTDGAQGAARGAGIGSGVYHTAEEAFQGLKCIDTLEPEAARMREFANAYERWVTLLNRTYPNL